MKSVFLVDEKSIVLQLNLKPNWSMKASDGKISSTHCPQQFDKVSRQRHLIFGGSHQQQQQHQHQLRRIRRKNQSASDSSCVNVNYFAIAEAEQHGDVAADWDGMRQWSDTRFNNNVDWSDKSQHVNGSRTISLRQEAIVSLLARTGDWSIECYLDIGRLVYLRNCPTDVQTIIRVITKELFRNDCGSRVLKRENRSASEDVLPSDGICRIWSGPRSISHSHTDLHRIHPV